MNDTTASSGDLQFDRVELGDSVEEENGGPPAFTCGGCQAPIADTYYEIGGHVACPSCHAGILAARSGGSAAGRFLRALVFGLAAGAVGFGIYYTVLALTGYEVGLIAIVVGFLVGAAVRAGAQHRGGWLYQLMAIGITYVAIVSTYVPLILSEIRDDPARAAATATPEGTATTDDDAAPIGGELVLGSVAFFAVVMALPFLAGFENVIGILIIGFALYQAWKLNQRVPFEPAGPFQVGVAT